MIGATQTNDDGFTLIELLLAMTISVLITGAIGSAFIITLQATKATESRVQSSHDAQLLSAYLTSDVVSAGTNGVDTTSGASTGCASSPVGTNVVKLTWAETLGGTTTNYAAEYRVISGGGAPPSYQLVRYSCTGGDLSTVGPDATVVAHGLQGPSSAVATVDATAATISISVTDADGYIFIITGAKRTGGLTVLTSLGGYDVNGNGKVDQVKASFSGTVTAACLSGFSLTGIPSNGTYAGAIIDPTDTSTADLRITENAAAPQDTSMGSMKAAFAAPSGCGLPGFSARAPDDLAPPHLIAGSVAATDTSPVDGRFDTITAVYSEAVQRSADFTAGTAWNAWQVAGIPSGGTWDSSSTVTYSGTTVTLGLHQGAGTQNTAVPAAFQVSNSGDIVSDAAGNTAPALKAANPADAAGPVVVGAAGYDMGPSSTPDGRFDEVRATFSEPVTAVGTPSASAWTMTSIPSYQAGDPSWTTGATVTVNGSGQAVLDFSGGSGVPDTSVPTTSTWAVGLTSGAAFKDAAGNSARNIGTVKPADKAGPVAIAVASANNGSSAGKMETSDTVTVTFSEPVIGWTAGSVTVTETDTTAAETWAAPGFLRISPPVALPNTDYVKNNKSASCPATVAPVSAGSASVRLTIGTCSPNTNLKPGSAGTLTYAPDTTAGLTDALGNAVAASSANLSNSRLF